MRLPLVATAALAIIAGLAIAPLSTTAYGVSLLNRLLAFVILAVSFDILRGHTGYVNLGHAAFFGLSAYLFGILFNANIGVVKSWALAFGLTMLFVAAISYPLFRLRGAYFAVGSLAVALLLFALAFNLDWLTQGYQGLAVYAGNVLVPAYYALAVIAGLTIVTATYLARSTFGLTLRAIREDEVKAAASGISVLRHKILAFIISAIFPAAAGGLFTWHNNFINPESAFGIYSIFAPVTMALFGGSGTILGPVVGALLLTAVQETIFISVPFFRLVTLGVLLVLVGLVIPSGLASIWQRIAANRVATPSR